MIAKSHEVVLYYINKLSNVNIFEKKTRWNYAKILVNKLIVFEVVLTFSFILFKIIYSKLTLNFSNG